MSVLSFDEIALQWMKYYFQPDFVLDVWVSIYVDVYHGVALSKTLLYHPPPTKTCLNTLSKIKLTEVKRRQGDIYTLRCHNVTLRLPVFCI